MNTDTPSIGSEWTSSDGRRRPQHRDEDHENQRDHPEGGGGEDRARRCRYRDRPQTEGRWALRARRRRRSPRAGGPPRQGVRTFTVGAIERLGERRGYDRRLDPEHVRERRRRWSDGGLVDPFRIVERPQLGVVGRHRRVLVLHVIAVEDRPVVVVVWAGTSNREVSRGSRAVHARRGRKRRPHHRRLPVIDAVIDVRGAEQVGYRGSARASPPTAAGRASWD